MKKIFVVLIAVLSVIQTLRAQNINQDSIVSISFGQKPELYFSFPLQHHDMMQQLTRIVSIDNVSGSDVIAVANKKEFALFLEYDIPFQVLLSPNEMLPAEAWTMRDEFADKSTNNWDYYPTYQAYLDMMAQFVIDYPALCRIDTIGYSVQGRLLLSAVISDNVNVDEDEPEFLYTSTMHGDEVTGYVLMLRLIDYLLSNYGTNTDVTNLVNNVEIYINPNANPDGTYYGGNSTVANARRNNYNNYDLNRNYPDPTGDMYPDGPRQIETQYFMDWAQERDFVMSANFHGGAELLNYPWDYTTTNYPDKQWWIDVCIEYAQSAQSNSPSGYFDDNNPGSDYPGVIEGATWYTVNGSRQDYMQFYANCREVTNEISSTKMPAASSLPNFWTYNSEALFLYIKQVLFGFRGVVTDDCTGLPLKAKIELIGHDAMNSHVFSSLPLGNYHRPVEAGTYSIKASAPGYADQQYTNVSISDYNTAIRNFTLTPNIPVVQFEADKTYTCDGTIVFQNNSIASQDVVYAWDFGDGTTSGDIHPVHTYTTEGMYNVKLVATSCAGTDSLIRSSYIHVELIQPPLTADQSNCGPAVFTLNATATGSIYWWDAAGTTILDTGSTFVTPLLTQTTFYNVSTLEQNPSCTGGKVDNTGNGTYFNSPGESGLVFTAHKPLVINTADVYADSPGMKTFRVTDSGNNTVSSVTVNVPSGQNTVQLGLEVPAGSGMKLLAQAYPNLFRNESTTNIGYPFQICDLMTITTSTEGTENYNFFYNIEAEAQTTLFGGMTSNTTNGGYFTSAVVHGLYFDCAEEVVLKSVKVYSGQAGNRTISLRDASDNLITSAVVNIPSGESRIVLNMTIPSGNGLKLLRPATPNLWRDGATSSPVLPYPFNIGDVITITGNSASNPRYYYYFYDWEVEKSIVCESPKVPVAAYIHDTPVPSFTWNEVGHTVTFTNTSTGGGSFQWNFGDGSTSSDQNPVYTYTTSGNYTVTLTQNNDCGSDVYTDQLLVTSIDYSSVNHGIKVFPNPVGNHFFLRSDKTMNDVEIYNLFGQKLMHVEIRNTDAMIQVDDLPAGTYVIRVMTDDALIPLRIFKL